MTGSRPDSWMPMYWGDYFGDTKHLTTLEHGAYLLLIGTYWRRGGPLPDDSNFLSRAAGVSRKQWFSLAPRVMEFFSLREGEWHHGRIEKEILRSSQAYERLSAAAKRRWSKAHVATSTTTVTASKEEAVTTLPPVWKETFAWLERILNLGTPLNGAPIHKWLEAGADLELDIKPTVTRLLAAKNGQGPPNSLNYFTAAIAEAVVERKKPMPKKLEVYIP